MHYTSRVTLAALISVMVTVGLPSPATAQSRAVAIDLELGQEFYYEGDALKLKISVRNVGGSKQQNPLKTPLFEGFKVRTRNGKALEAQAKSTAEAPAQPSELAPGSFYGGVVDLTESYPQLKKQGTYEIYWAADGVVSQMIVVTIVERYDPLMDYIARIDTDLGTIVIDCYTQESPIAVKSFVDMARVGFYEGMQFHEVHADAFIAGGDPLYADRTRRAIQFPTETSPVPLVAGTVVLKPISAAPPANSSTFMIILRPQPAWSGQVTALGQVLQGMDVVRRISQVPSSLQNEKPFFKPLKPVRITKVTIAEKKPEGGS